MLTYRGATLNLYRLLNKVYQSYVCMMRGREVYSNFAMHTHLVSRGRECPPKVSSNSRYYSNFLVRARADEDLRLGAPCFVCVVFGDTWTVFRFRFLPMSSGAGASYI